MQATSSAAGTQARSWLSPIIVFAVAITVLFGHVASANSLGVTDSEYNALVALYNSTNGPSWTHSTGWLTSSSNWYGVSVTGGHVTQLYLQSNLLNGSIPVELGDLTYLTVLNLRANQLIGEVPSSVTNLSQLQSSSSISYNGLWTTSPAVASFLTSKLANWNLTQTVAPTGISAHGTTSVTVSWTPITYTSDPGYYEIGVSAASGGPYTFDNSRRTGSKTASSFVVSGMPADKPQYYVVRTVTTSCPYGGTPVTSPASAQVLGNPLAIPDSEYNALVALYNSTNGPGWTRSDRWMTNYGAWWGLTISGSHVTQLNLQSNALSGSLPSELGALTSLTTLNLRGNQLLGAIPSSLASLTQLQSASSYLSYNGLWNTDATLGTFLASKFPNWDQTQTIAPTNLIAHGTSVINVTWTPISYTGDAGYYEVGISSTAGGPYTFDSSHRTYNKSTAYMTFSGLSADTPKYFVVRTVTTANPYCPATPTTSTYSAEALANGLGITDSEFSALVALYNATGGPSWTHSDKWLTNGGGWYGLGLGGTHVSMVNLPNNLLTGSIPAAVGNLTNVQYFNLKGNSLKGEIPSSITNLTQLTSGSSLSYNGLWTTDPTVATFLASKLAAWDQTQTIAPTNVIAHGTGNVSVSWTTIPYTTDVGYYEIGISSTAGGPYSFDSSRRTGSKSVSSFTIGNLSPNSPYFFAVRTVTLNNSYNQSTLTSDPSAEATGWTGVKNQPDNYPTAIVGAVVTASFPDCTYVEAKDKSYGIRVTTFGTPVTSGVVNISGTMASDTSTGERYVRATNEYSTGPGQLAPVATTISNLGGASWNYSGGAGQVGVTGGTGLNNIGILVKICGHITARDTAVPATWFTLDDGSGATVKCAVPTGVTISPTWNYVSVTGISSCERPAGDLLRLLRVTSSADIVSY